MNEEVKFSEFLNFTSGDLAARVSTISLVGLGDNAFGVQKNIKFSLSDFISYIGGSINAFSNGGNSFGVNAKLGTNDAFPLYFRTNNTDRGIIHSNGRLVFGGTTDNGYGSDFYGTMAVRDSITLIKNSVSNVFTNEQDNNTKYTKITNVGSSGGFMGGVVFGLGSNRGSSTNLFWFSNTGAFGIGTSMGINVENAGRPQLLIKGTDASPAATFGDTKIKLFTDDYLKYTFSNGKVFSGIILGGSVGATIPDISNTVPAACIGYQYHPLVSGWATDMVFAAKNDIAAMTEVMRVCGRDQSVGIGVTEPSDRLHISGNIRLGTAGNKIKIKSGTNASIGSATLVAGTVTVNTTSVSANSIIFLTRTTSGGTVGTLSYTIIAGTSFTINSSSATDTSTIGYIIIDSV